MFAPMSMPDGHWMAVDFRTGLAVMAVFDNPWRAAGAAARWNEATAQRRRMAERLREENA